MQLSSLAKICVSLENEQENYNTLHINPCSVGACGRWRRGFFIF